MIWMMQKTMMPDLKDQFSKALTADMLSDKMYVSGSWAGKDVNASAE